jgi:RNA polymerase sigma factor (TIGR02999 family)
MSNSDITGLLLQWSQGSQGSEAARNELISLLYSELRGIAASSMSAERAEHTLQPTALVHETWFKLIDQRRVQWRDRAHFFGVAAGLMRRILVDHARKRGAQRRGGGEDKLSLDDVLSMDEVPGAGGKGIDVLALDSALEQLSQLDEKQARIVELRFFGGLSADETAEAVGLSRASVYREWDLAKAWLHRRLTAT